MRPDGGPQGTKCTFSSTNVHPGPHPLYARIRIVFFIALVLLMFRAPISNPDVKRLTVVDVRDPERVLTEAPDSTSDEAETTSAVEEDDDNNATQNTNRTANSTMNGTSSGLFPGQALMGITALETPTCTYPPLGGGDPSWQPTRRGRALVMYHLHDCKLPVLEPEWGNMRYFLRYGIITGPTRFYDGVDYMILQISPNVTRPTLVEAAGNVNVIHVPEGGADLVSFYRVLTEYLPQTTTRSYARYVILNSGVAGPFFSSPHMDWVDFASAEFPRTPPFDAPWPSAPMERVAVGSFLSGFFGIVHLQSFFVSMSAHDFAIYIGACKPSDKTTKTSVIKQCEVGGSQLLLSRGSKLYSMSQQLNTTRYMELTKRERIQHAVYRAFPGRVYPFGSCQGFALKRGGVMWRVGRLNKASMIRTKWTILSFDTAVNRTDFDSKARRDMYFRAWTLVHRHVYRGCHEAYFHQWGSMDGHD